MSLLRLVGPLLITIGIVGICIDIVRVTFNEMKGDL